MVRVRKYYLNIIMCCLLAVFMSFQVAAEETSKKISSKQHKAKGQQVQSPAQGQPRIVLDATTFDAGKVWEGEEVSHAFTVKNEGTAMLEIKNVKPGWGCTVASFDKAIPPGQEGKITLKLRTTGVRSVFSKSAVVSSNDPQQPAMTISLSCTVEQYVSVLPSTWIKLEGYEGDKITQQVTVTTIEEKPLTITKITCDINDKIKYKLKSKKKGKEYVLEVRNRIAPVGTFRGTIELKTTSEKKPTLVINVYANFLEEVKVEPQVVSFGVIDTSKENFDAPNMKKIVTITDMRGSGLTLNKIKSSGDWIVAENQKRGGRQYNLVIGVDKNKLPKGRFQEKITIRTNYKQKKSLLINVNGEVL